LGPLGPVDRLQSEFLFQSSKDDPFLSISFFIKKQIKNFYFSKSKDIIFIEWNLDYFLKKKTKKKN